MCVDVLQQKYVDTSQLYSSLLSDRGAGSNGDGSHQKIEELERMVSDLQKTMDDQVTKGGPFVAHLIFAWGYS